VAAEAEFTVYMPGATRLATAPIIAAIADALKNDVTARTPRGPTGELRAGWKVVPGRDPATRLVVNDTPYGRYVEYGTRHLPARPALGQTAAAYRARYSR
jgi:hypothetical protein